MQENADGKMSCVSIFAYNDSFAEGMINIKNLFLNPNLLYKVEERHDKISRDPICFF